MLFSIIIPNFNKASNIPVLLSSIFDSYRYEDFEVFFMDDASTDSSVIEARKFPVYVFVSEKHLGPAALRNMAAKEACGEYLLFIDSDVIIIPNTLIHFRNLCLSRKFTALSGLEVLPPVVDNWIGNYRTLQIQDLWGMPRTEEAAVDAWGTTFGAIRRDSLLNVGGFNESYTGADIEEHELAGKINGEQCILFAPQLTFRHTYVGAVDLMIKQFRRASQMVKLRNTILMKNSLYGWRFKFNHLLAAGVFAGIVACLFDQRWVYFVIIASGLRSFSNCYLLSQALKVKGLVFAVYCYFISLIMSLCVIAGAVYGKLSWGRK